MLSEVNWSDNDKWKLTSDNSPIKKVNFDNFLSDNIFIVSGSHFAELIILSMRRKMYMIIDYLFYKIMLNQAAA